ncbi:MAG TPA: hypothetical protein VG318_11265 [Actinomycetota bacterium]|nr:hypothetical protein [Actinomycetota bacterium]
MGNIIRTRVTVGLVAAFAAASSLFTITPAHASTCDPDPLGPDFSGEEQICYTVMRALCAPFEKFGGCPFR